MHVIDSDNAGPAGEWIPSDATIPRHATRGTAFWFNAVQNELKGVIEAAGLTLRTRAADIAASYSSQLLEAIRALNPTKATAKLHVGSGAVSIVWSHGVTAAVLVPLDSDPSKYGVLVTFNVTPPTTPDRVIEAYMMPTGTSQLKPNVALGEHVDVTSPIGIPSNQSLLVLYEADGVTPRNLLVETINLFVRVTE